MLRFGIPLLMVALLGSAEPAAVSASPWSSHNWGGGGFASLGGAYVNTSNGRYCEVIPRGRGFVFVNENGSPGFFAFAGPNQLRMVHGQWDPRIVVSVDQDRFGRTVLRFDAPFTQTGFWVQANY